MAADIVRHFLGRGFVGKAMVVSIDKATALRMHDKVKQHWAAEAARVQNELGALALLPPGEATPEHARRDLRVAELKQRLNVLDTTDMALIVSPGQNEIQQMQALGLDIEPHRKRMNESKPAGSMKRLQRVGDAVNALISPDPLRRDFLGHERLLSTLYGAVKPDPAALEFASRVACVATVAGTIRSTLNPEPIDISAVMNGISAILDNSITGHEIRESGPPPLDLSKINFEALAQRFKASAHKNTDLEVLKAAIRGQLEKMISLNRTRADFGEKFEALIESYNAGSRSIEELFQELLELSNGLNDEQQRHLREHMSEEELVIFDILTRPAPELSTDERAEVKKVARELLGRLKDLLVLDWRTKGTARAQLKLAIEDTLDAGLPRAYTPELYQQKCSAVFEHVYERYPERDVGVYAGHA